MLDRQKHIQKFKDMYQKKNGVILSDKEALQYFECLIVLVQSVYQPIGK